MPVRTVVEEFCDICFSEDQQETPASEHLRFAWLGRDYVLLACEDHAGGIRDDLQHLADMATPTSGRRSSSTPRPPRVAQATRSGGKTLFSQLTDEEKARFRKWADLPRARRIADLRVEEWTAAGRP